MSTVAELLVKIGGNNAGLKKTLNDSQTDMKKAFSVNPVSELTGALTSATGGLSSFVGKVSTLSTLAAGGFGLSKLISGAVAGGENIYQLSTKMGITAAEASNLNKILKLTGSDTDSFAAAMTKLDKSYSASGEAGDKVRGVLSTFGVSLSDSTGKLLPLNQQLAELSKGYKVAAANGLEQEFIMSTLGVKGLSLVQTLKDYSEASEMAAKTKGVGIDPKQMHELDKQMKVVSMQAGALGSAFTGALAPVAQEVFPPILEGLSSTAKFLAEHKSAIGSTVTTLVGLTAAYKTVGAASAIIAGIGNAWSVASAQAIAASTTTATATSALTIGQERAISRMVAQSAREYAKLEAAAIKTATASAGSTEAASAVIAQKISQIAAEAKIAADKIRVNMTAAFVAQAEAATASAIVVREALAAQGVAATTAGTRTVLAAQTANAATASSIVMQGELATAHTVAGNSAVVQGERTAGAMAVAKVASGNFLSSLWALAGGWVGVGIATAFAISKLIDYMDGLDKVQSYNAKAEVWNDPNRPGKHLKGKSVDGQWVSDTNSEFGGYYMPAHTERVQMSDAEEEDHGAYTAWKEKQDNQKPWLENNTDPDKLAQLQAALAGKDTEGLKVAKDAAKEAGQVTKEEADYEIEIARSKSKLLLDSIKGEQEDLDRERKGGLNGIRQYWASREKEDSAGLSAIKEYWDKRTALDTKGINAELETLNAERNALETQIAATSDPSDSIKLKKQMLDLTTSITLKERELGEVIKKNSDLANTESVGFIEKYASLMNSVKESMKNTSSTNSNAGLFGSSKDLSDMENEKTARLKSIQDIVDSWERGTAEIKDSYGVAITDTVGMEKWRAQQVEMINKQTIDKVNRYYATGKALQADLDEAYNTGNLAEYQKLLDSKQALIMQDLKGQQAMADLYKTVWSDAHMSMAEVTANIGSSAYDGLKSNIADVLNGTESIRGAWNALGSTIGSVIADMAAKWIAAQLAMAIFGKSTQAATGTTAAAGGATVASAWAPAAAMVSLATMGANAGPAMTGIALTTGLTELLAGVGGKATGGQIIGPGTGTSDSILSWLSNGEYVIKASAVKALGIDALNTLNTGRMPAYATGGLVTGRSLSSISGRYNSAMPNQKTYEKSSGQEEKGSINSLSLNISALDGKSVEKWLKTSGGAKIEKYFAKQASAFAASGVRL